MVLCIYDLEVVGAALVFGMQMIKERRVRNGN